MFLSVLETFVCTYNLNTHHSFHERARFALENADPRLLGGGGGLHGKPDRVGLSTASAMTDGLLLT